MQHVIEKGKAYIIEGRKNLLAIAEAIAEKSGKHITVSMETLRTNPSVSGIDSDTIIIVDGFMQTDDDIHIVKTVITAPYAPRFIFCSGDTKSMKLCKSDRRFIVVDSNDISDGSSFSCKDAKELQQQVQCNILAIEKTSNNLKEAIFDVDGDFAIDNIINLISQYKGLLSMLGTAKNHNVLHLVIDDEDF